jgi:hypothetical protein
MPRRAAACGPLEHRGPLTTGPDLSLATRELREAGVAPAVVADVGDFESVQQAVSQIARDLGPSTCS